MRKGTLARRVGGTNSSCRLGGEKKHFIVPYRILTLAIQSVGDHFTDITLTFYTIRNVFFRQ
jgi:hypothetical protein